MSWAPAISPVAQLPARDIGDRVAQRDSSRASPAIIGLATLLGLVLRVYQLVRPHLLLGYTGYDDGVDFGSALWLIHGALPYRDYVFVQPPGITLLMAPAGLLSKAVGSDVAFGVARILTSFAGAASIALAGLLVRHRGRFATAVVCGILAIQPHSVFAARTVLLEPWLVLFCLAGAAVVFDRGRVAVGRRRLLIGGLLFGFAGLIKVWAILPVIVLAGVCWHARGPRATRAYLGGVTTGFVLPLFPFLLAAPQAFVHEVITVQLTRTDLARVPAHLRLTSMIGLSDLALSRTAILAISAAVFAIGLSVLALTRSRLRSLDRFAVASLMLVGCAFLWPTDYYIHYGAFFAPFFALSVGIAAASAQHLPSAARRGITVVALGGLVALAIVRVEAESKMSASNPGATLAAHVPVDSCLISDDPSLPIVSGRVGSGEARCPKILDPVGLDYSISGGINALGAGTANSAIQNAWLAAFARADFVWLSCFPRSATICDLTTNRRIPLTGSAARYLAVHFRRVPGTPAFLFRRVE